MVLTSCRPPTLGLLELHEETESQEIVHIRRIVSLEASLKSCQLQNHKLQLRLAIQEKELEERTLEMIGTFEQSLSLFRTSVIRTFTDSSFSFEPELEDDE